MTYHRRTLSKRLDDKVWSLRWLVYIGEPQNGWLIQLQKELGYRI